MKQKNNSSNNLLTKDFFKSELKKEFGVFEKQLDKKFVKKDFFERSIDNLLQDIRREITFSTEVVMERVETRLTKHTSLILTAIDPLLKELETRREDREIAASQHSKLKNQVDNH